MLNLILFLLSILNSPKADFKPVFMRENKPTEKYIYEAKKRGTNTPELRSDGASTGFKVPYPGG